MIHSPVSSTFDTRHDAGGDRCALEERGGPGTLLAGRYLLGESIGSGGSATVWAAIDQANGRSVALKAVSTLRANALARARHEVAALRWADLPGVVRMVDEWVDTGTWYIVMERIDGRPFPGRQTPCGWEALRGPALALLEILARLHASGLLHLDLKPPNVLVEGATGAVRLLDFGLARGAALAGTVPRGRFEGTPGFAAPEQWLGGAPDERTDLYAVGVMLAQALVGWFPNPWRRGERPPSLSVRAPGAPPEVLDVIDALLCPNPSGRPSSAMEVIALLGGVLPGPLGGDDLGLPAGRPATARELRRLFHGPDVVLHLREDASRELYFRTGGRPDAVRDELAAWVRAGLCHWVDGAARIDTVAIRRLADGLRLRMEAEPAALSGGDRSALDCLHLAWPDTDPALVRRLAPVGFDEALERLLAAGFAWRTSWGAIGCDALANPARGWLPEDRSRFHERLAELLPDGHPGRLRHLLAAGAPPPRLLSEADAVSRLRLADGEVARVWPTLELGLGVARQQRDLLAEDRFLRRVAVAGMAREDHEGLERALYELGRAQQVAGVEDLVRAERLRRRGEREAARVMVGHLGPFEDEDLEVWRQATRVMAAASPAESERLLGEFEAWAAVGPGEREARRLGWLGDCRYEQGRYSEAAELHLRAYERKATAHGRLFSLRNAASALLEDARISPASKLAGRAALAARRLRSGAGEASAIWLVRTAAYRRGILRVPRPALVDAAEAADSYFGAALAVNEAAVAWRCGATDLGLRLAARAVAGFSSLRQVTPLLLARCLEAAVRGRCAPIEYESLAACALDCSVPDIAVQCVGLLARVSADPLARDRDLRAAASKIAEFRPRSSWTARLDVLSVAESLDPGIDVRDVPLNLPPLTPHCHG